MRESASAMTRTARLAVVLALAALAPAARAAERATVCTVTVNSPDEREAFRRFLPPERYRFVELVEHGRPDWLRAACERRVRCDVLVVSGHFAGTEFYSSRPEVNETLPVDEIERVACSASCPDLFAHLKEAYLFGCDTLKPEPVRSAMPEVIGDLVRSGAAPADARRVGEALSGRHGESAREHMRRIFPGVPVIYGFSSLAPYGRVSGPLLARWLGALGAAEVGSGVPSAALLRLFGPASMVATSGMGDAPAEAAVRRAACVFHDDRVGPAQRLAAVHRILAGDAPEVRMGFETAEKFFAAAGAADRSAPAFAAALASLRADGEARARYLALARATADAALRVRMIALGRTVGWLTQGERRAELARTVVDLLGRARLGLGDVDLVCELNLTGALDDAARQVRVLHEGPGHAAALACLGDASARGRMLRALASADEREVQIAQSYLRYRPITDRAELAGAVRAVAAMRNPSAQARALDALGRLHLDDPAVLAQLAALFARTHSLAVQRAVAEAFLRGDPAALDRGAIARLLRERRLPSPSGEDVIDAAARQLAPDRAPVPRIG